MWISLCHFLYVVAFDYFNIFLFYSFIIFNWFNCHVCIITIRLFNNIVNIDLNEYFPEIQIFTLQLMSLKNVCLKLPKQKNSSSATKSSSESVFSSSRMCYFIFVNHTFLYRTTSRKSYLIGTPTQHYSIYISYPDKIVYKTCLISFQTTIKLQPMTVTSWNSDIPHVSWR